MVTDELQTAADAIAAGEVVVYPTETVYGLGADALDSAAVKRVFEIKGRDRSKPVSMAVPDIDTAAEHTRLGDRERRFAEQFLPGPVTLVVERGPTVPDVLTAGRDKVGIRIPDHEGSRELARRAGPTTATSANVSGHGSARHVTAVSEQVRDAAAVVIDGGKTPGGGSTVVDVSAGEIHRRGADAAAIEAWLGEN
ncbi:translation factor SUA5 [Halovenus aranensis]|uniref:L-threonylcarbamoyladenylate synthase n=1 Tax=Halovenus aranensis TaxID=890420 RepID=A0A1G8TJK6_9EURY|nr:L-threonylcarbamoyladenylate synthase [Halovenus aranensis]SDJ41587.1 translation factor SUA5 [Halovenus aranensis]